MAARAGPGQDPGRRAEGGGGRKARVGQSSCWRPLPRSGQQGLPFVQVCVCAHVCACVHACLHAVLRP